VGRARDFDLAAGAAEGRQPGQDAGVGHAGESLQARHQLTEELLLGSGGPVLPPGERNARHQQIVRVEAEVHRLHLDEAHHQAAPASRIIDSAISTTTGRPQRRAGTRR
jgi:hypothetical protein